MMFIDGCVVENLPLLYTCEMPGEMIKVVLQRGENTKLPTKVPLLHYEGIFENTVKLS
nr:hypothetical protein [uncultured Draconibacterium sp.]